MKKKKNEKPKEKMFRVTMEMTEDHIRATCDALEVAWRTAMGQTEHAIIYAEFLNPLPYEVRRALANVMRVLLFPDFGRGGYHSICGEKIPPGPKMAYEVGRQLAHVKWIYDEPERKANGIKIDHCTLSHPPLPASGLPLPKIMIEEIK